MRFVSKSADYHAGNYRNEELAVSEAKVAIVNGKPHAVQAEPYVIAKTLPIKFSQAGLLQSDIDAAMAQWRQWSGLPLEEDGVTPASPVENGRIGVWDSEEWQAEYGLTDEDREGAETLLLRSPYYGPDFVQVAAPVELIAEKPWPSYDDTHHFKIPGLAVELGLVDQTIAYEQANKAREGVLKALTEKTAGGGESVVDEVVTA